MPRSLPLLQRFGLAGRRALVVGVGPGIGSAMAHGFAEAEAEIMAVSRTPVRVNAIAPSNIEVPDRPEALARAALDFPLGRTGSADEVPAAALFLASDAASFVTGDTLHVDGGRVTTA